MHQAAVAMGRNPGRTSPYARQQALAAARNRQNGATCSSADIAQVTVQAPLPGGRPVGQGRVTREIPSPGGDDFSSPAWPASPALGHAASEAPSDGCSSPAGEAPPEPLSVGNSPPAAHLPAITEAACLLPPDTAFRRLDTILQVSAADPCLPVSKLVRGANPLHRGAPLDMNRTERAVYQCLMDCEMSTDAGDAVLRVLRDKSLDFREVRFASMRTYHTRIQQADLGIAFADLTARNDGQEVIFWYRSAWRIVLRMLQNPQNKGSIRWCFERREHSGERVFSSFNDSVWLEGAHQQPGMEGKTILGVMIGSDGAKFKKSLSGHPIYVSCANFCAQHRQTPKGWSLLGFVPELDRSKTSLTDQAFARRMRQIMDTCLCLVTEEMLAVVRKGGVQEICCDMRMRTLVPLMAIYPTDRQEHELVLHAKVHSCFHCTVPADRKSDYTWRGEPKCASGVRTATRIGMTTGVYGAQGEWKRVISVEKPIMCIDPEFGTLEVVSGERYEDFARVVGHYPEPNNFMNRWSDVGVDLLHSCRDDPMHMVQLGLMEHLMQACISRCISALSPEWACASGHEVGPSGMIKICERLGTRLEQSAPHLKEFAAQAVSRTFRNATKLDARGGGKMSWGLTAFEMEALFRASVLCWPGLIDEELKVLNSSPHRPRGTPDAEDPANDMVATVGWFLSWYNGMRQREVRQSSVRLCVCVHAQ